MGTGTGPARLEREQELLQHTRQVARRLRRLLYRRSTTCTDDFVGYAMRKWLSNGEYEQLLALRHDQRRLTHKVRSLIIDRLRYRDAQRRNAPVVCAEDIELPDADDLFERLEDEAWVRWLDREITRLEQGEVDDALPAPSQPQQCGRVLRMVFEGQTKRDVAQRLGLSVGSVVNRERAGVTYLGLRADGPPF